MSKKLLYQLEQDLYCSIEGVFSSEECDQFDREVGEHGIHLVDTDGRKVVSFQRPRTIIVSRGYKWDGCSPKFHVLDLFWFGTPDGIIIGSDRPIMEPDQDKHIPITHERITHLASVVHDVLGYCKSDDNMPTLFLATTRPELWKSPGRRNRDRLFCHMLKAKGHQLWWLYYGSVYLLGPLYDVIPRLGYKNIPKALTVSK